MGPLQPVRAPIRGAPSQLPGITCLPLALYPFSPGRPCLLGQPDFSLGRMLKGGALQDVPGLLVLTNDKIHSVGSRCTWE